MTALADILDRIPTRKSERWKFTNLPARLKKLTLEQGTLGWSGNVDILNKTAPGADKYADTALWDLNLQNTKDCRFIDGDAAIDVHAQAGKWYSPYLRVNIKKGQQATVIEKQSGDKSYWKNQVVDIVLEEGAILNHIRFQDEATDGIFTNFTHVTCAKDARYNAFTLTRGDGLSRNQIHVELQGPGADATIYGVNLLFGKQHADTTITVEHQAPNCTSNQFIRSVLAGESRGVFQGKVHVHRIAQKTDGYQLSNALLLSPLAEMDTKPELEIYADDVKCSHGATTGQLDEEPLFYMQSRGIPRPQARMLLIQAFLAELVDKIGDQTVKPEAEQAIEEWLHDHAGA